MGGGRGRPCPRAHVSGKAFLRLLFLIASNCLLEKRYYGYTSIHVFLLHYEKPFFCCLFVQYYAFLKSYNDFLKSVMTPFGMAL